MALGLGLGLGFSRGGGGVKFLSRFSSASAAYSLRQLSTASTNVVRVRRSDNVEQDFNANEVSNGTLQSFIGESNLLEYSEQLDQSPWATNATTVTANQGTAPDGTLTADLITRSAISGDEVLQVFTNKPNTTYYFSVYAKQGSGYLARISILGGAPGLNAVAVVDLRDGSINFQSADVEDMIVEDAGDGWYRISVSDTTNANVAGPSVRVSPDGTGNTIYAWGAQLHEDTIGDYVKTEGSALDGNGYVTTLYDQKLPTSQDKIYFTGGADAVTGQFGFEDGVASTLELRFIYSSFSTHRIFGSQTSGGSAPGRHSLEINSNGTLRFFVGVGATMLDTTNTVTSGLNTVILTYDGANELTIQLNGGPVSTRGSVAYTFLTDVVLGASYGGTLIGAIPFFSKTDISGTTTWDGTRAGAVANGWEVTGEPGRCLPDLSRIASDLTQTTAADQPLIIDNSELVTSNNKPAINFNGNNHILKTDTVDWIVDAAPHSIFATVTFNAAPTSLEAAVSVGFGTTAASCSSVLGLNTSGDYWFGGDDETAPTIAGPSTNAQHLMVKTYDGSTITPYLDGTAGTAATSVTFDLDASNNIIAVGGYNDTSFQKINAKLQEAIIFDSDQSSDVLTINKNINGYWRIY